MTFRAGLAVLTFICATTTWSSAYAQGTEPHGWLNTETLKTRFGDFEFKNGYPAGDTAAAPARLQKLNRAIEVYTDPADARERDRACAKACGLRRDEADSRS